MSDGGKPLEKVARLKKTLLSGFVRLYRTYPARTTGAML
jgi:hypothetical protein